MNECVCQCRCHKTEEWCNVCDNEDIIKLNWENFHNHCLNCAKCKKIFDKEIKEVWNHMLINKESTAKIVQPNEEIINWKDEQKIREGMSKNANE